ncbi:MAG: chemotaxis protein [Hyphomicrobiales bacterium]|nr:chemotaxis protein [Hyphomicrobiales bacterium]PCH50781.1 MAG: chemotaxis protein [Hyphomicrobiales bacterium]
MNNLAQKRQDGGIELSHSDFNAIAGIVRKNAGIDLNEAKLGLVKSRLQKRLRTLDLRSFRDYLNLVNSSNGAAELDELICAISTNVTSFNREPHHFVHFREKVLPSLIKKMKAREKVRIWSAGCSNGSEAFTVACAVLDAYPDALKCDFKILASDIDKYSLETGRSGIYSDDMVAKMPGSSMDKWFEKVDSGYAIDPKLRSMVSFKTLNLMAPWPIRMKYDVIFCRNVLIYFTQEDQAGLFNKFSQHLLEDAFMYIGHSERVVGTAAKNLISVGATTYQYSSKGSA